MKKAARGRLVYDCGMTAFLAAVARPFVYLIVWGIAAAISWLLWRWIPSGRLKDALYKRRH